jgi:hypothetical protein
MPCFRKQQPTAKSRRSAENDRLIDSLGVAFDASRNRTYRNRASGRIRALVRFLQANGLVRAIILKDDEEPSLAAEVWQSDLTEEGKKLIDVGIF